MKFKVSEIFYVIIFILRAMFLAWWNKSLKTVGRKKRNIPTYGSNGPSPS